MTYLLDAQISITGRSISERCELLVEQAHPPRQGKFTWMGPQDAAHRGGSKKRVPQSLLQPLVKFLR